MRTGMAEGRKKSVYKERFLFDDPLDRVSGRDHRQSGNTSRNRR